MTSTGEEFTIDIKQCCVFFSDFNYVIVEELNVGYLSKKMFISYNKFLLFYHKFGTVGKNIRIRRYDANSHT